jgi:hypothetical protein
VIRGRVGRPRRQGGAVTAELALALPILVAVTWGLVWLLSVGVAQVRMVDAARETARAVARGDATSAAVARGQEVAPADAVITVATTTDRVLVTASATIPGPGGMFGWLPGVRVQARAVAATEGGP